MVKILIIGMIYDELRAAIFDHFLIPSYFQKGNNDVGDSIRFKFIPKNNDESIYHNLNGPAAVWYYDGTISYEVWMRNGKFHRHPDPADILYRDDGTKNEEIWYENGKKHRICGPAYILYFYCGRIRSQKWYVDDILIKDEM